MASEPKTKWLILTSNTQKLLKIMSEFLNYVYTVKGFKYHSRNYLNWKNNTRYLNVFFVIFFS